MNPHPVRDPCINAIEINRSAVDLTSCVDELTFLKEQSVAMMKQHAVLVASEFLQSGFMEERYSVFIMLADVFSAFHIYSFLFNHIQPHS